MSESKPGIIAAIAAAMGEVQKVAKNDRNPQGGYRFASIDDFLALVNPICAKNGLVVMCQEDGIEDFERSGQRGTTTWMRVRFLFTVHHASGEHTEAALRTVEVLRNGAQAYGSAQSYALKQFLRSLLLIPTGDNDDADHRPTDDSPVQHRNSPLPAPDPEPQPMTAEEAQDAFARMAGVVNAAPDGATLAKFIAQKNVQMTLDRMPEPKRLEFKKLADERAKALTQAEDGKPLADAVGDEIPY